ncbi:MAG: cytochrome c oxidase assembly protein [Xanthobacteraceae bacterium]|nr:cytochrome c oxidase assembly protein [Xanthobacteraceae bacterium]QYK45431.1 MAG: cytochrome c oxidase assembly protein [Xanthobacteraceae bacterium]
MSSGRNIDPALARRHRNVALSLTVFVAFMVGASFAAVPFYDWFCRTTGFGGVPQIATSAPEKTLERTIRIRFDANVAGVPWEFQPEVREIEVKIGETFLVHYFATNLSRDETVGTATYNVSPPQAGIYFAKMQCFCFTEQRLAPGEKMAMPVAFFIQPAIDDDFEARQIKTITLSYTFFPVDKPKPLAATPKPERNN